MTGMGNGARPVRIAVAGPGDCDDELAALAEEVGVRLGQAGAVVITGGGGGVMAAASHGARKAGGITVGILPGLEASEANPDVLIPLPTGLGEARNMIVAAGAQVLIAVGGEAGTLSEIALALKTGRPVIGLKTWTLWRPGTTSPLYYRARDPADAVREALARAQDPLSGE